MTTSSQTIDLGRILEPRGLKESDLAEVLGVSERTVLFWRSGERKPSPEHAMKAERLLNIPKHELRPDLWEPPPPRSVRPKRQREAAAS